MPIRLKGISKVTCSILFPSLEEGSEQGFGRVIHSQYLPTVDSVCGAGYKSVHSALPFDPVDEITYTELGSHKLT